MLARDFIFLNSDRFCITADYAACKLPSVPPASTGTVWNLAEFLSASKIEFSNRDSFRQLSAGDLVNLGHLIPISWHNLKCQKFGELMEFVAEIFWRYKLLWMLGVGLLSIAHQRAQEELAENICCWQLGPGSAVSWHQESPPPLQSLPSQGTKGSISHLPAHAACSQAGQRFWHREILIFLATLTSVQRPGVLNWPGYGSFLKYQGAKIDEQDFYLDIFLFFHLLEWSIPFFFVLLFMGFFCKLLLV